MKPIGQLIAAVAGTVAGLTAQATPEYTRGERWLPPLTAVRINDEFWAPRLQVYSRQTLPHSWQYVNREIEDNEIAAGWRTAVRGQDTPWNQANLHKVLETAAYAWANEPSKELDQKLDGIISAIAAAQQPNGYCNALVTVRKMNPWANLDGQHDGYVAGHLIEAAVAHYLATGKTNFLNVATRVADHVYDYFITQAHPGVCGHAELELALLRLYRVTGNPRHLALARNWIERRGKPWNYSSPTERSYFMDHLPIRQVQETTGHAVRTMFYLTAVAEVGLETGDRGLQQAARRLWADTTQRKMYVTGGVGSQEKDEGFGAAYDLPNAPGYNESCAACGLLYFAEAMFRLDGKAESIDVLERTLYNTILHGISLDGTNTYYRNPLTDENRPRNNIWVCCPPCLSRTLLRLPDYIYAQSDRDIYVNLYVGSSVSLRLKQQPVSISQAGDYLGDGRMRITVNPPQPDRFCLRLRQPGWCRKLNVSVNGNRVQHPSRSQGYLVLNRRWQPGDTVDLEFSLPVERVVAHPNVAADQGCVALQRGPLVFGLEALDHEGRIDITLPAWPRFTTQFEPDLLGGIVVIHAQGTDGKPITAIPFYSLANRGLSKQRVWIPSPALPQNDHAAGEHLYRSLP
jgi:uncharacterized protein